MKRTFIKQTIISALAVGLAITFSACSELKEELSKTMKPAKDMIQEAIRQETADVELITEPGHAGSEIAAPGLETEPQNPTAVAEPSQGPSYPEIPDGSAVEEPIENVEDPREPTAEISNIIPTKYLLTQPKESGSISLISYPTRDYFGDGGSITKQAYVYLPYGYSDDKQYNVLYLMHGIGGDETEWGMDNDSSKVKLMMDNLIYHGDIEPFIVVTPNGRSSRDNTPQNSDFHSFYVFGQELRNDLIPYIEQHYATYAAYDANGYDLSATREHRAMAGLSMGGMQTINIGIGECVDLFGYFGAFSAAPTSNPADITSQLLYESPYEIYFFYNICGTEDVVAYESAAAAAKALPDMCGRFIPGETFLWQELEGEHDFRIWYLGFYNFAQIAFSK